MREVIRDIRFALRALRRAPGFACLTIATISLGIGANSAIFSVVSAVILQPLAYPHPEQLLFVASQFPKQGFDQFWVSGVEFLEFRERVRSFSSVGAFVTAEANLTGPDRPLRIQAAFVSRDLFTTLGVEPVAGRIFSPVEDLPNGPAVALVSFDLWQSAFGGAPIVGRTAEINGIPRTIVGVMPRGFDVFDQHVQALLPLGLDPADRRGRASHYLYLIGRLRPGSTLGSARAELDTLLAAWPASVGGGAQPGAGPHTPDPVNHRLRLDSLQSQIVGGARTAVWVLQGAVLLVLLIACVNLANLLLARAETRRKEFAVRSALGASRGRLLAQFMVEGTLLSGAGAVVGVALAVWGVRALVAAFPASLPRAGAVSMNVQVLGVTIALALVTGLIFGLAPLLHLAPGPWLALKDSDLRAIGGSGRHRVRHTLVATEVALAVSLVIGAGLLLRTVLNLTAVDSGFSRTHLVTFAVSLPSAAYAKPEQVRAFYHHLIDDLESAPGVHGVAAMSGLPPVRQVNANDTDIDGYVAPPDGPIANVDYYNTVTAGYVETMGIPVVEGRAFEAGDAAKATVMINQTMARTFYKDRSPIGRRVRPAAPPSANVPWYTIVGVLKDVKQGGVDHQSGTELYFNLDQVRFSVGAMNVVMRTNEPADGLAALIRAAVARQDRSLPVVRLRSMDDVFADAIARPRLLATLLGLFAALALALAAIGTYGLLRYLVTERRKEIGIRMALGADRRGVLQMILSQGLRLTIAGVIAGLTMAVAMNRAIASLLYGVTPSDPMTISGVIGVIVVVALSACFVPAYGATRVDPMIVLRDE